jgi:hypothetical protein
MVNAANEIGDETVHRILNRNARENDIFFQEESTSERKDE